MVNLSFFGEIYEEIILERWGLLRKLAANITTILIMLAIILHFNYMVVDSPLLLVAIIFSIGFVTWVGSSIIWGMIIDIYVHKHKRRSIEGYIRKMINLLIYGEAISAPIYVPDNEVKEIVGFVEEDIRQVSGVERTAHITPKFEDKKILQEEEDGNIDIPKGVMMIPSDYKNLKESIYFVGAGFAYPDIKEELLHEDEQRIGLQFYVASQAAQFSKDKKVEEYIRKGLKGLPKEFKKDVEYMSDFQKMHETVGISRCLVPIASSENPRGEKQEMVKKVFEDVYEDRDIDLRGRSIVIYIKRKK